MGLPGDCRRGDVTDQALHRGGAARESDPVTLAKTIATLDHLSGGRVTVGAGFGWNTDELADHGVPAGKRRTVLREYVEAMRALWTQEEAAYDGEFVKFGPCWAFRSRCRRTCR